jgi:acyl carrier protein
VATEEGVVERIRQLVVQTLQLAVDPEEIGADEPLFGGDSAVDSIGSLELVAAIEAEYGIRIPDEDLRVELFDSVRTLARYVCRRAPGPAAAATAR